MKACFQIAECSLSSAKIRKNNEEYLILHVFNYTKRLILHISEDQNALFYIFQKIRTPYFTSLWYSERLILHISVSSCSSFPKWTQKMAYCIGVWITHDSEFHLPKARQWCQKCLKKQLLAPLSALFRYFPSFFHYFTLSLPQIKEMKICCKISLEENGKLS